mmetsp:Transcript_44305/g.123245  ORF Transcript_44305/g.123245 Transcript_44305/m.123245 type:complete len:247 (-) Transcript_44305:148-888(-)
MGTSLCKSTSGATQRRVFLNCCSENVAAAEECAIVVGKASSIHADSDSVQLETFPRGTTPPQGIVDMETAGCLVLGRLSAPKAAVDIRKVCSPGMVGSFARSTYTRGVPCEFLSSPSGERVAAICRVSVDLNDLIVISDTEAAARQRLRRRMDISSLNTLVALRLADVVSVCNAGGEEDTRIPAEVLASASSEERKRLVHVRHARRDEGCAGSDCFTLLVPSEAAGEDFVDGLRFLASSAAAAAEC